MTSTIINKERRKEDGLPEVKITNRATMYTSPKAIISSRRGQELLERLSQFNIRGRKVIRRKV